MSRILVVDNQPQWRDFSQRVLKDHGHQVSLAESILQLDFLLREDGYDLVLLNADLIREPFLETIRTIFRQNSHEPIVVVSVPSSSHQDVQETRVAFKLGAKDCVPKPFSTERLLALVKDLLAEYSNPITRMQGICP